MLRSFALTSMVLLGLATTGAASLAPPPGCSSDTGDVFLLFGDFEVDASMWRAVSDTGEGTIILVDHRSSFGIIGHGVDRPDALKLRELVAAIFDGTGTAQFSVSDIENIMSLFSERTTIGTATQRMLTCVEEYT